MSFEDWSNKKKKKEEDGKSQQSSSSTTDSDNGGAKKATSFTEWSNAKTGKGTSTIDPSIGAQGWRKYLEDTERVKASAEAEEDDQAWWEKLLGYLGTTPDTSLPMGTTSQVVNDLRVDDSHRKPSDDWSWEQRHQFGALYLESPAKAYDYATKTNAENKKAKEEAEIKAIQDSATSSFGAGLGHTIAAVATAPMGLADYLADIAEANARGTITNDGMVSPFEYSQAVTEGIGTHLNEKGGTLSEDIPIIGGKGWGDVYSVGTSIAQSMASAYTLGGAGTLVSYFGQGAAAGVDDAMSRGASEEQAVLYGTALGVFEGLAEKIGVDNLFKLGSTGRSAFIKDLLKQAGAEGMEEGLTSLFSNIADNAIMQDKSNFNAMVQAYMAQGMSESDAKTKAWWDSVEGIAFDTITGSISGGVHGGIHTGAHTVFANIDAKKTYGGQEKALVGEAREIGTADTIGLADKYQSRLDKGKSLTGAQLRKLVDTNEQGYRTTDTARIASAAEARLTEFGETGDVKALSGILAKQAAGESLSRSERATLEGSKYGKVVAEELSPEKIRSDEFAREWVQGIGAKRINADVYNLAREVAGVAPTTDQASAPTAKPSALTADTTEEDIAEEPKFTVSEDGKTTYNGKEVVIKGIDSITDGNIMLRLESGETVSAKDVRLGSQSEALVYEAVTRMGASAETANLILENMDGADIGSIPNYVGDSTLAYRYGTINYKRGLADLKIPEAQKELLFERGRKDAETRAEQQAPTLATKKTADTKPKKNGIFYEDETIYDEENAKPIQKESIKQIEKLAKLSPSLEFHVYSSVKEGDGRVAIIDGERVEAAPNGYFTDGNKVYIDLNAGNMGEGTMLYTASHEIGHYIRRQSAKAFKAIGDFLIEQYGERGVAVETLIEEKKKKVARRYKRDGKSIPSEAKLFDTAYEELVCDAMSTMLASPTAYEKLAALKAKDRNAFQILGDAIKAFLQKVKALFATYKKNTPDAIEAQRVMEFAPEVYGKLQDLYLKAFVEADANYEAAERTLGESGIMVDSTTDYGTLCSVRDLLDSKQQQKVAEALAKRFNVTVEEAKGWISAETSLASLILNPKYSQYLDYVGDASEEAIKSNSDYPQGTVDFSNICKKRRDFTEVMNRVLRNFPNHVFAATDLAKIRTIMSEEGMEVACGICYVEDRRQLDSIVAQDFIDSLDLYRKGSKTRPDGKPFNANQLKALKLIDGDTYTPSIYELISLEGRNLLRAKNPAMEEAWVKFNNARGMQSVRLLLNDAEYKRQILKYSPSVVARKNDLGGLRIYSFSDMEMFHLIDVIQVITDSATVGLSLQGYTKVNEYARAVKDTGEKLNRSLIPKGDLGYHMEGSEVVLDFDTVEGIDINHPDFFDNIDNPNIGNIVIGINPTQIRAAMTSRFIDQIIPFHTGQSGEVLGEKGIAAWVNYKDSQSERDVATGKKSSHQINIYTEVIQAAEKEGHPITNKVEFVSKFLEVCKENALIPRFSEFLNTDESGNYVYTEGYHKFLVDFKTFDQTTGEYLPQMPVKPIFDSEYLTGLLKAYVKTQKAKDAHLAATMPKVLERITKEIVKADDTKFSDRDSEGNTLTAEQQEFFKDSKVRWGNNLMPVYHGTRREFTVFDTTEGYDDNRVGGLLWAAKDYEYAKEYSYSDDPIVMKGYLNITNLLNVGNIDSYTSYESRLQEIADLVKLTPSELEAMVTYKSRFIYDITSSKGFRDRIVELGYDGVVAYESGLQTFGFVDSNQFKNIDNTNPTSDPDIRFSERDGLPKITAEMSDAERTEILRKKKIVAPLYTGQADASIARDEEKLHHHKIGVVKATLERMAEEFGIIGKEIRIEDVDVSVMPSKSNIGESLSKHATPEQMAKLLPILREAVSAAIGIEVHSNRYYHDTDTTYFENLVGGFVDGQNFVPVRFGLKHSITGRSTLYVVVDQDAIPITEIGKTKKTEVLTTAGMQGASPTAARSVAYSISEIVPLVNSKDLLRYFPDDMLSPAQRKTKWEAIAEAVERTDKKNDERYIGFLSSGNIRAAKEMVLAAAKAAGYTHVGYHGTHAKPFTVFARGIAGIYLATNRNLAEDFATGFRGEVGTVYNLVAKIEKPFVVEEHIHSTVPYYYNIPTPTAMREAGFSQSTVSTEEIAHFAEDNGYDGVIIKGIREGADVYTDDIIVFDSNQVKSADPITYDDNGDVIPLSKRFNAEDSDIRYSLRDVDPVEPTTDKWQRTLTTSEVKKLFPNLWDVSADESEVRNPTQISGTVKSYRKVYDFLKKSGFKGTILDASSGLGYGTRAGIEEYGFDVEDIEPYPDKSYTPKYTDYSALDKQYDAIISNAVLNVLPQDQRDALVVKMGELLKVGGRMFINVRGDDVKSASSKVAINEELMEYYISKSGSYQKGFAKSELVAYLQDALGDGFTVMPTTFFGKASAVVTKNAEQKLYQERDTESVSTRSLLANALESAAQNDIEREKIAQYKEKIALIEEEYAKLSEIRAQIRELSFAKGPRDTEKIRGLQFEEKQAANRINTYDRQLLNLQSTTALKNVLEREKKLAYEKAKREGKAALTAYREKTAKTQRELLTKWQESRKRGIESRNKTEMRHKIRGIVDELNKLLLNPTKDKHVPISLQKPVAEALEIINMDTIGAAERVAKYDALIAKAKDPDEIRRLTATRDRIQMQGENLEEKLKSLRVAYDEIVESDDPLIANSHDQVISERMKLVIQRVGSTPIREMTLEQLEDVYDMYKMVLTAVRNANRVFKAEKGETISFLAGKVMVEVEKVGGKKPYSNEEADRIDKFNWDNQKPIYAFERIGSPTLTRLYEGMRSGEDTWATDVSDARAYYLERYKKYRYDAWDFDKRFGFTSTSGKGFELSLGQIMSLYAYSKRAQSKDHIKKGGIVIDETTEVTVKTKLGIKRKVHPTQATAYNISDKTLAAIIGKLTPEQSAFVDEMQDYLSTVMGDKGNEVSLELYGIKLFKDKNYFPLKSAPQFMAKAKEQQDAEVKIKNKGMTQSTVPNASNPIRLTPFMDVWSNHVNEMSMYHAFVLALENFYRVYNYRTPTSETMATESVEMFIQNAYGKGATQYIDQLLRDLNGGAISDPRETIGKALMSKFKKASVMSSLSVVVQQPTAMIRAMALVDAKYFRAYNPKKHKTLWAEVKKYAPVAIIKEMGYFDTNMGRSTKDYLMAKEYNGLAEKAKALFTDGNYRDEVISRLPALADELAWVSIWEAVKRETMHKYKSLSPTSEAFLKKVGERFTEVVTKTQVYDSVLARSGLMRSKSTLVNMWTSFMGEPTTSLNMLQDALLKGKRGNKKYTAKVMGAVFGSVILNSVLVSLVYAMRDDDEDESYLEKYLARLSTEILDGINPLTYIPIVKDVWSIAQGFDVERADMALVTDLLDSIQKTVTVMAKDTEDMDEDEFAEHQRQVAEALWSIGDNIASLTGIPLKNLRREIKGFLNLGKTIAADSERETTAGSLMDEIWEDVKDTIPVVGWLPNESKADKLYDAIVSGDAAYRKRIEESYDSKSALDSAIRKALRENDPRIKEAAEARKRGDTAGYMRIAKSIISEGNFSQDNVVAAINAEVSALSKGESTTSSKEDKESSIFKMDDYYAAIVGRDQATAAAVREEMIRIEVKNGKDREDAEESFVSSFVGKLRTKYEDGDLSDSDAKSMLTKYAGKSKDEAASAVQYWGFKRDYPGYDLTEEAVSKYYSEVDPYGISVEVYYDYTKLKAKCEGTDEDGDGETDRGSLKREVMRVIHSLPLTKRQKDALYYLNGWAESSIHEAPWR